MIISHQTVVLARGRHAGPDHGMCVMELASTLAGEPFTDHPRSVCPVIAALLRDCNDRFDDRTRQRLYRYAAASVGTAGDTRASKARLQICADALRGRPRGMRRRWFRGEIVPPRDPLGPGLRTFARAVVRSFRKGEEGDAALLALVDDLLAVPSRPDVAAGPSATRERALAGSSI